RTAARVRSAVHKWGLETVAAAPELCSNAMTAVWLPASIQAADLLPKLKARGVVAAGGILAGQAHRYFRLGHMGISATRDNGYVDAMLKAAAEALEECGHLAPAAGRSTPPQPKSLCKQPHIYSYRYYNSTTNRGFKATIGLELHVQLKSSQKLFSSANAKWDESPNTNVNLVDAGLPGALPQLNPECIKLAARAILAFNGKVQSKSAFDRKHYFYADQPLGYQITQQRHPIGRGGYIEIGQLDGLSYTKQIGIQQLQLEQDTAKSIHGVYPDYVMIDMNRAGVALLEIVSNPDMETAEEAVLFVRKLQLLLRHMHVSNCNMEEGSLRCDVNVSVYRNGENKLSGTRCELKNLNSFKVIRDAINAEISRQIKAIENNQAIEQETRGYDARKNQTFVARSKEAAPDYRYMPEPDVPEICISDGWIDLLRKTLPETPAAALERIKAQYGIAQED
ncbi:hypothetical protein H4R22_004968, partial [Coemansia sp. RSA 1290]